MTAYIGIHSQIVRNNRLSILYLLSFPILILFPIWGTLYATLIYEVEGSNKVLAFYETNREFIVILPYVLAGVAVWFIIAYFGNTTIINAGTHAKSLSRTENPRVYNLTENLCMSIGMTMPKLQIIESPVLNAFASGINEKTYSVTLTRGIIDALDDKELEGVIAHELTHIRNRDVRLMIISIIFVGILAVMSRVLLRNMLYIGGKRKSRDDNGKGSGGVAILVALLLVLLAYFFSILFKLGISRKREYMADAGAADMTKNPRALASALRKISGNNNLEFVNGEMKQLFIANNVKENKFSSGLSNLFATHPPIEKRIEVLENF
ncbi:MAG: M48 family metallopeptidase [Bacteroidetes bacterium]|nr:M48 family metallopeptidase [Bacteroidota bacterium]